MSNVRSLIPTVEELGQCEAFREGKYANDTPETDKRCSHTARYAIYGKRLCAKHAGVEALRLLMLGAQDE